MPSDNQRISTQEHDSRSATPGKASRRLSLRLRQYYILDAVSHCLYDSYADATHSIYAA